MPNIKPLPARPLGGEPSSSPVKPTPARELGAAEARETPTAGAAGGRAPGTQPDLAEARLEADGSIWTVRVLGRSERAGGRSPPLLLLGFWSDHEGDGHEREAMVVGRMLSELTPAHLEEALARSKPPPQDGRRKPFFDAASQARRGASPRQES